MYAHTARDGKPIDGDRLYMGQDGELQRVKTYVMLPLALCPLDAANTHGQPVAADAHSHLSRACPDCVLRLARVRAGTISATSSPQSPSKVQEKRRNSLILSFFIQTFARREQEIMNSTQDTFFSNKNSTIE
jgi:hypothetical protein